MNDMYSKAYASIPADMQRALDNFDRDALQIVGQFQSELEKCYVPPDIYHYTTDIGLRGILESGQLWLTDIFSLNDPSELRHGFGLATDVLDEKAKNGPDEYRLFADNFKEALNDSEEIERSAHYFVCSFSKCGDDLGQWRAYADNGCGYALGFNTEPLKKTFCAHARRKTLNGTLISDGGTFPVSYDDCRLSKIHGEIIEKVLPLTSLPHDRNLSRDALRVFWAQLLTKCAVHLLHASVYFKHKAYINEDEYRFLEMYRADVAPVVKFRARNYSRIKYREFDWKSAGTDVLKQIVIGPAADLENSKRFAEDCLREAGIDPANVTITQSQIPYKPT